MALIEAFLIFSLLFVLLITLIYMVIRASIGLIRDVRTRFSSTAAFARTRTLEVHSRGTNLVRALSHRSGLMPLEHQHGSSARRPALH